MQWPSSGSSGNSREGNQIPSRSYSIRRSSGGRGTAVAPGSPPGTTTAAAGRAACAGATAGEAGRRGGRPPSEGTPRGSDGRR
eukprot:3766316-Alexandrium_andersonii.AAC.2